MRKSDDSLDAYQVPETDADFKEIERDGRVIMDLMHKWGWTRIQRRGQDDRNRRIGPYSLFDIDFYNENSPIGIIESKSL